MIARLCASAFLVATLVALDQGSKLWAKLVLQGQGPRALVGTTVIGSYVENRGVLFGGLGEWLSAQGFGVTIAYGVGSAVVLAVVLIWQAWRNGEARTAATFLLGGVVGNLVDRFRHGAVVDFISVGTTTWRWPSFNLADVWIAMGLAFALWALVPGPTPTD